MKAPLDEEFEEQQQASNKKPLQVNVVEDIKATSSDKAKKTPKRFGKMFK